MNTVLSILYKFDMIWLISICWSLWNSMPAYHHLPGIFAFPIRIQLCKLDVFGNLIWSLENGHFEDVVFPIKTWCCFSMFNPFGSVLARFFSNDKVFDPLWDLRPLRHRVLKSWETRGVLPAPWNLIWFTWKSAFGKGDSFWKAPSFRVNFR